MGFIESKKDAIDNVALLEVLGNLPKGRSTSSLGSINSKSKNLLPFLLDLLSVTCKDNTKSVKNKSRCEATRILTNILIEFFPTLMRILKEGIIKAIKAGLACSLDFTTPQGNIAIKVKLSEIDFNGLLKINPTNGLGSTFYGKNANTDLNWFLNDLIQGNNTSSWNNLINFSYDSNLEELTMSLDSGAQNKNFDQFLTDYLNNTELFTTEQFLSKVVNGLTGSLDAALKSVSLDSIIAQEKTNAAQKNINNSDPSREEYQVESNYFTFTNDELFNIEKTANEKYLGVTLLDLGCGLVESRIDPTIFESVFNEIKETPSNKSNLVIEKSIVTINNNLTNNVSDVDKKVSQVTLNTKMLELIPTVLTNIIFEPKIVLLYLMSSKIVNGPLTGSSPNIKATNSFDYSKASKVFFEFITRESLAALLEIIFKQVKDEILKLVAETSARIIKEQVSLKSKAISSVLTAGVNSGLIALGSVIKTPNTSEFT
jgi:hypothetical protein